MKSFKEHVEQEQLDEELMTMIGAGIVGILAGLLINDAVGLNGERFYGIKKVSNWIKSKFASQKVKSNLEQLAQDPEVKNVIDTMMQGRAFKKGMKSKGMAVLNKKLQGKEYSEVRKALDELVAMRNNEKQNYKMEA